MGTKVIWDGEQLPPIGCDVLIKLASTGKWHKYEVTGYQLWPSTHKNDEAHHRIFINVKRGDITNQRLLYEVKPVDWREED